MTKQTICAVLLAACATHLASAETWYWTGEQNKYWVGSGNWTNVNNQAGYPKKGDTAVLGWGTATREAHSVCGSDANKALHEIRFEGNKTINMSQGVLYLQGGGGGLKYMHDTGRTDNWMGLRIVGSGEVPIHIDKAVNYALQGQMTCQDGSPTLVKTGPGKFICFNEAGGREYSIPLTLLRQGAIDITTSMALSDVTFAFDGDDASQRIYFSSYNANHDLDLVLNNAGLYETNGVANAAHGFSSPKDKQVKFTGTPKQNPTVFSGQFYDKAGLNWAPGSADYTFVCSNAVSATTGQLIVGKGTVKLVTGASFTALSTMSLAAGAVFEVEEGSGGSFHADILTLADATAQLKLGTGVSLDVGSATLKGNALPYGTYTADGANGTRKAAWIEGAGSVTVANGPANIDTWSGAGADNLTSTDLNWASESAPDVTAGDLLATFATGGTEATLPAGTAAAFDGLVLDAASLGGNAFAFTAGSGATAAIGASGISVLAASAATVWTMGWPITVAGGAQTWTVGANNTLKLDAPWGGDQGVTVTGGGAVELNATSTHSGVLTLDKGAFKVTASNALGTNARTVRYHFDTATLRFEGDTVNNAPISGTWGVGGPQDGGVTVAAGANAVFGGRLALYNQAWIDVGAGATATFRGGITLTGNGMAGHLYLRGGGTLIVTNTPVSVAHAFHSTSGTPTLDLRVANNNLGINNRCWVEYTSAKVVTRVANAINSGNCLVFGNGATFDLDGHNQSVRLLHGLAGSTVTSAAPATLSIACDSNNESYNQNSSYADTNRVNMSVFAGCVGLTKNGAYPFNLGGASTSTGPLKVTAGRLILSGSWANCTNAVVAGGTFTVRNANAFGDVDRAQGERPALELDVAESGATLELDYAGRIDCKEIRVAGVKQYGTFGAVGSGAANEVAWIVGAGTVRALPNGTVFTIR